MFRDDQNASVFERAALFGFLATLLLPIKFNAIFIYVLGACFLYFGRYKRAIPMLRNDVLFWLLIAYVLVIGISGLYSEDPSSALKAGERRLPLIVLPLLLAGLPWDEKLLKQSLQVYVLSIVAVSIYSVLSTISEYQIEAGEMKFFSHMLPVTIGLTSTYYGLFVVWALIFIMGGLLEKPLFPMWAAMLLGIYLTTFLFLVSSRVTVAIFLACIGVLLVQVVLSQKFRHRRKVTLIATGIFVVAAALSAIYQPYIRQRLERAFDGYSVDPRYIVHRSTIEVIRENPVWGVGIGDVDAELRLRYEAIGFQEGLDDQLNPHNDWLHTYAAAGLIGLAVLLSIFFLAGAGAMRNRDFYSWCFMVFFLLGTQTESILNRQKGVVLFSTVLTVIILLKLFAIRRPHANG